jgi:hypothetical protein
MKDELVIAIILGKMKNKLQYNSEDYLYCGEVQCTQLAEATYSDWCNENNEEEDEEIPDVFFDAAVDASAWWDHENNV